MDNLQKQYDELCEMTFYWAKKVEETKNIKRKEHYEKLWADTEKEIARIEAIWASEEG